MLRLFDTYAVLFKSWRVIRYEQEAEAYLLQLSAILQDDSRLELRDYLFADGSRKYAYQWMEADCALSKAGSNARHRSNRNHLTLERKTMACHHEVLKVAQEIVAMRGKNEFAPIEVVRFLRERGTQYAESTIRTHVISRCCANAPPHHAVRYSYFERIGKGRYRILRNE